ncbi:MAG: hypothetical protein EP330_03760 [Deltaproteobacteria bacterium]|nr:MAG: hypothetical protein EP330_03760 [Deltaproteobacteria bacterium]
MPRPLPVPDPHIKAHVGGQPFYNRGWAYHRDRRVARRQWSEDRVYAAVQGNQAFPYQVEARIGRGQKVVSSTCTCAMGGACKHVAALLIAFEQEPTTFREIEAAPPRAPVRDWQTWAEERGVADLLDEPVTRVFSSWRMYELPLNRQDTVRGALTGEPRGSRHQQAALSRALDDLVDWLEDEAQHRRDVRHYNAEAESWREVPPRETWLVPLYSWLRASVAEAPPHLGLAGPELESQLHLHEDPPAIAVPTEEGQASSPIPLQPRPDEAPAEPAAARAVLDVLTHPDFAGGRVREWMSAMARIPTWERALMALDQLVDANGLPEDPEGREPGWRIEHKGTYKLTPVWVRPFKTKGGLRAWPMGYESERLTDPRDREALDILKGYGHAKNAQVLWALAALIGHPRVIWERGEHMAVRKGEVGLEWRPAAGGVELVPTVDDDEVDAAELLRALDQASGERLLWVDVRRSRLVLCPCPPGTERLLRKVLGRSRRFPPEAVEPMLRRFESLSTLAPMRLRGELRGEAVAPDLRPLVRLAPAPDGSLELVVRSRVLPGSIPQPPGRGPDEVAAVRDGVRVFAERQLDDEPEAFRHALAALDLPDQEGFTWTLDDPEQALPVVLALREHQARFQVEWSRPPPRISRRATAGDLKVKGDERRDWFGVEGGLDVDGDALPLADLLLAIRSKKHFVRLDDGGFIHLSRRLVAQLKDTAESAWDTRDGVAIAPLAAETLAEVEADGAEIALPDSFRVRAERLREAADLDIPVPEGLNATLRPYQVDGLRFLARLAHWAPGAVLADDMGLGKTLQTLALLLRRRERGPALVVAPASVNTNWMREAARFAPGLDVRPYRGSRRLKLLDALGPNQVLVTSWDLMTRDAKALSKHRFATVVLDEAQAIKNPGTRRARASVALDGEFVVALTGTPVENRVGEVWSLFRTVVPGLLGPAFAFKERFVSPIEKSGSSTAQAALSRLIRPFLLRRLKSEVARDLPAREEVEVRIALSRAERRIYDRFRTAVVQAMEDEQAKEERFQILAALTRLRQLACDARLVDPDAAVDGSSKLDRLVHLATDLRDGGHQALVFSQFTGLLGYARTALEEAGLSVRYLDGSTPLHRRQAEVDAFQAGDGDVFLISLKAGGVGLNLTAASYVVHLDPWWNPAAEDQATDRAHRIGQTQPVTVYRFVAVDTVEERVLALHDEKRALVEGLLAGTGKAAALSTPELLTLLGGGADVDDDEDDDEVEEEAGPWAEALLLRFQTLLDEELDAGRLSKPSVAQNYRRVVNRLVSFVRAREGALRAPEDVAHWGERYLVAVDNGEVAGLADQRHAEPAFRRLGRLLLD